MKTENHADNIRKAIDAVPRAQRKAALALAGLQKSGKGYVIVNPSGKYYSNGHGWVDGMGMADVFDSVAEAREFMKQYDPPIRGKVEEAPY